MQSCALLSPRPHRGVHRPSSTPSSWRPPARPWNPLHDDAQAADLSRYFGMEDDALVPMLGAGPACQEAVQAVHEAHAAIRDKILQPGFPCVAARSALNRKSYRFGLYPALGSMQASLAVCHDLYEFSHEFKPLRSQQQAGQQAQQFTTFIAAFDAPGLMDEVTFERLLWRQLQQMHGIDARHFEWDEAVARDPQDPDFSFSIGGRAYFVVGMHPGASRRARRTAQPILVFNPHDQFEALRQAGKFEPLQRAIRERDLAHQGSLNPVLSAFGQQAESRQYSGRAVPAQWQCPFRPSSP